MTCYYVWFVFVCVAARFHVKQPPAATGLRVIYNPGPVSSPLEAMVKCIF